jgi:hypothetical protein
MRHVTTAILIALATASHLSAQLPAPEPPKRFTIAPIAGWAFGSTVQGDITIGHDGFFDGGPFEYNVPPGAMVGLSADYLVLGRLSASAAILYGSRGRTSSSAEINGEPRLYDIDGSKLLMARLGARFELIEPVHELQMYHPRAWVYGGLAMVHENPPEDLINPALSKAAFHPGLHLGVDAEVPTKIRNVSLRFGLDDTFLFWRDLAIERAFSREIDVDYGRDAVPVVLADNANLIMAKIGLAYRF